MKKNQWTDSSYVIIAKVWLYLLGGVVALHLCCLMKRHRTWVMLLKALEIHLGPAGRSTGGERFRKKAMRRVQILEFSITIAGL